MTTQRQGRNEEEGERVNMLRNIAKTDSVRHVPVHQGLSSTRAHTYEARVPCPGYIRTAHVYKILVWRRAGV